MRGTIIAYYIYVILFIITLLSAIGVMGLGSIAGPNVVMGIALGVLPSLLFVGWIAYVLKGCVDVQKAQGL